MPRNATVTATDLPSDSGLHALIGPSDFVDCYAVNADIPPRRAAEIVAEFPGWTRVLMVLRRVITTPFGLSNDGPDAPDKIGSFPVEQETETEIIAGFDDRHLNFRVSIISENGRVWLATWVHTHNIGGRIYLAAIMPFHIMVARDALQRVARAA